jgi:hypothetical protein
VNWVVIRSGNEIHKDIVANEFLFHMEGNLQDDKEVDNDDFHRKEANYIFENKSNEHCEEYHIDQIHMVWVGFLCHSNNVVLLLEDKEDKIHGIVQDNDVSYRKGLSDKDFHSFSRDLLHHNEVDRKFFHRNMVFEVLLLHKEDKVQDDKPECIYEGKVNFSIVDKVHHKNVALKTD